MVQVRQSRDGEVKVAWAWPLGAGPGMPRVRWLSRGRHGLVQRRHYLSRSPKVRRSHPVMAQLRRVHHHLRLRMLVVLGHGRVRLGVRVALVRICSFMKTRGRCSRVMDRASVLLMTGALMGGRVICVLMLALLARMRLLARVVHIVVPYSISARQRASETWVPPERTALNGRRTLDGKNLIRGSPFGLRCGGKGLVLLRERRCGVAGAA